MGGFFIMEKPHSSRYLPKLFYCKTGSSGIKAFERFSNYPIAISLSLNYGNLTLSCVRTSKYLEYTSSSISSLLTNLPLLRLKLSLKNTLTETE